ncbi:hypothetical protein Enr13x_03020 [Stieleria neptunia]|uniref:Uncharacterized protein n=1 Tax=Stieleria neptunia TaxID=2527979 RepID=A0A518HI20_9BACT|nr:hypothetical protein [Stieleria neptunia]QDV40496.1 hypothetical protein Enr13x_03020 [Stieleria neptunia]
MLETLDDRLQRFEINAELTATADVDALRGRTWLALTSSHLGTSPRLHAEVCRYISRSMIEARQAGHVLLVAAGSAIEPWAVRAADLFSVPVIRVHVNASEASDRSPGLQRRIEVRGDRSLSRDWVVVALADRVDCVFTRRKGNVERSLRLRLDHERQPTVRVAVHDGSVDKTAQRSARDLMGWGAVGWYCRPGATECVSADGGRESECGAPRRLSTACRSPQWATTRGRWLVHCTRTSQGPWPGQTDRQHRDGLLLGETTQATIAKRTPLDSLQRIVRMRRLVASAIASDRAWPVVCFSEESLQRLLSRRSYRPHLHRWDYEPYGIAIRKSAAIAAGAEPVIYGDAAHRKTIPETDRFRFQSVGTTYDWTRECEWRFAGDVDLDRFDRRDVRVFVADRADVWRVSGRFDVSVVGQLVRSAEHPA